ncbi:uncharacterized protein LOC132174004 [Corylus avellana]|uniref:uncharacterized protein LOC132174004 n=1 Tax=Corylus avellana TaxID=13451 RepID=UPI00286AE060|nr:uncharacterized protein LOC132167286 isoform X2 [Corylus avellana]XP_059441707.1 uncharacterized protein LOC132174004 [Corylus avellana]
MARGGGFTTALIVVVVLLLHQSCSTSAKPDHPCPASSCGNIRNISYPFRLTSDPKKCGDQRYNLSCENNQTVLYLYHGRYYVQEIDYSSYTIRVVDPGVVKDNHPFIPHYLLEFNNFSSSDPYHYPTYLSTKVVFVNCEKPVNSRYHFNISTCVKDNEDDGMYSPKRYRYAVFTESAVDLGDLCQVDQISLASWSFVNGNQDFRNISCTELVWDFELYWHGNGFGRLSKIYTTILGILGQPTWSSK